MRWEFKLSWYG